MTETTAKKGMVRYKIGYGKSNFDFDYLASINYDDKRTMKQVIETLFTQNNTLKEKAIEAKEEYDLKLEKIQNQVTDRLDKFDKVFKQNIKEFLTRGL